MKQKRRLNIFVFFIIMVFIYLLFDLISGVIPGYLNRTIQNSKYGIFFTGELFWLILVIIVIYLFKSSHIFSEKKEGILKTFLIDLIGDYMEIV